MATHTPGPLVVCRNDNETDVLYIEQDREHLINEEPSVTAIVHLSGEGIDAKIGEANAYLYAAAPDLLAAVEHVLIASEDGGDMDDIDWDKLRAAIAKARNP